MSVLAIISAIFTEHLIAILCFGGAFFALREYLVRRQHHLLLATLYFTGGSIAFLSLYATHIFASLGLTPWAFVAGRVFWVFFAIDDGLLAASFIDIVFGKIPTWRKFAIAVAVWVPAVAASLGTMAMGSVGGLIFPIPTLALGAVLFGIRSVVDLAFASIPWFLRRRHVAPTAAHASLSRAGLFGLAFSAASLSSLQPDLRALLIVGWAAFIARTFCLIFGSLAVGHPDPRLTSKPVRILDRSLAFKIAASTALMFWLLAYFLLATTSGYFVRYTTDSLETTIRRDVHGLARSYSGFKALFLEETSRLADQLNSLGKIDSQTIKTGPIARFLGVEPNRRLLRIVDKSGRILYSSWSDSEVGKQIAAVTAVKEALEGNKTVLAARDPTFGRWSIWAAVPVDIGIERAVILAADISAGIDFADFQDGYPGLWTAAGFVSSDGDLVYGTGSTPDRTTIHRLVQLAGQNRAPGLQDIGGDRYAWEPVSDGKNPDGFFFVEVSGQQISDLLIRIVATVLAAVMLLLAVFTLVIVLSTVYLLRPVRSLRDAARSVEKENYDVRVPFKSFDELGDMARAFNGMSAAIADRTERLRLALNEQHDFLAHMVHEMRTPLNVFRWTTEMMRFGDTGRLSREQTELVEQMSQVTQRLLEAVRKLDDVSKLDRGLMRLVMDSISMEEIIDDAAGIQAVQIREKNINLHWNRPQEPWPKVNGDRRRLIEIMVNLIDNAVKYTPRNGHIEITGHVRAADAADPTAHLELTVEDNGRGIPKDRQDRVFTRFFRSVDPTREEIAGTGLGLYIVKELVKLHGGRIWFDSEEGTGTAFHFTLPITRADGA